MSKEYPPQQLHIPVLLEATLETLCPQKGESYLDLTAGYGGHAEAIIASTGNNTVTLVDRDENAIKKLDHFSKLGARLIHADFVSAAEQLKHDGQLFDMILIDLGVSSPQLDNPERGFSFKNDAPLDMRMDHRTAKSAYDVVNKCSQQELIHIITTFGEEPLGFARRIASAIRDSRPIDTTTQLASIIKQQYRGRWKKTHPATRTFQAIRMYVNDELGQIEQVLPILPELLKPDGRLAIISFHSLEDRLVKRFLKNETSSGYEADLKLINKKPFLGATQDVHNPRARSAKLRAAVKIKI